MKQLAYYSNLQNLEPLTLTEIGNAIAQSQPTSPEVSQFALACLQLASINCLDNSNRRASDKQAREIAELAEVEAMANV